MILKEENRTAETKREPQGVHHKHHTGWPGIEPGLTLTRLTLYVILSVQKTFQRRTAMSLTINT